MLEFVDLYLLLLLAYSEPKMSNQEASNPQFSSGNCFIVPDLLVFLPALAGT